MALTQCLWTAGGEKSGTRMLGLIQNCPTQNETKAAAAEMMDWSREEVTNTKLLVQKRMKNKCNTLSCITHPQDTFLFFVLSCLPKSKFHILSGKWCWLIRPVERRWQNTQHLLQSKKHLRSFWSITCHHIWPPSCFFPLRHLAETLFRCISWYNWNES